MELSTEGSTRISHFAVCRSQILENTPESHPDNSHLKAALEKAEELCSQVRIQTMFNHLKHLEPLWHPPSACAVHKWISPLHRRQESDRFVCLGEWRREGKGEFWSSRVDSGSCPVWRPFRGTAESWLPACCSSFSPDLSIISLNYLFFCVLQQLVFNSVTNCLGPRKFLHSGKLFKAKSSKELYGFLFNDFLLLTQVRRNLLSVLIPMSCQAISNICDYSQVTKPLGSSGLDKVFSSKTHLQYRMYKTVSTQPLLHSRPWTCLYSSVRLASRSPSSSMRCWWSCRPTRRETNLCFTSLTLTEFTLWGQRASMRGNSDRLRLN